MSKKTFENSILKNPKFLNQPTGCSINRSIQGYLEKYELHYYIQNGFEKKNPPWLKQSLLFKLPSYDLPPHIMY